MRKYIIAILIFLIILFGALMGLKVNLLNNYKLELNEIKAYFKDQVHLDYYPDLEKIDSIQIGGAISMIWYDKKTKGNSIYTEKKNLKQITDYLNNLSLVESTEDELPNKSPDIYIQYFDINNNLDKNFVIYGRVFIKDVNNKMIYRIKNANTDIVQGLEQLDFN